MHGMPYDPVVQLSTSISRLSVMEGRTLAIATYRTKLDDNFEIATTDAQERDAITAGMRDVEAKVEQDMDPVVAANQMDTDEVIELASLRPWLCALVEMSYQDPAARRTKNPRIWSLHDLQVLYGSASNLAGRQSTQTAPHQSNVAAKKDSNDTSGSQDRPEDQPQLGDGEYAFTAPMSGRYYDRAAPDQDPFVTAGDEIKKGDIIALLEIMKTFTRVQYDGEHLPAHARIKRILVRSGQDVQRSEALMILESMDPSFENTPLIKKQSSGTEDGE